MSRFATPRLAIMLVFSAFGALVGTWAGSIPQVTARAGIGSSELGMALAVSTLASVSAMGFAGVIGKHFSSRTALLVLLPLFLLLTIGLMGSTRPSMFLTCIILQAISFGLLDIFMNAEAGFIEHRLRKSVFAAFHGILSVVLAASAILSSLITTAVGPLASCLPAAALCIAAWVAVAWLIEKHEKLGASAAQPIGRLWWHVPLLLMGAAIGLSIAAESAAIYWSAKLVEEQSPDLARIFGIGVAFFSGCQALVRFAGDRLRARFGEINLMLISFAVAALSFAVLGLAPPVSVSVVAFAFTGMGLACNGPCLFALAGRQSPGNRAAAMAVLSLVAGMPRILAPLLFGWIAAKNGMVTVFGLASFIPLAGIAIVLWLRARGIGSALAA